MSTRFRSTCVCAIAAFVVAATALTLVTGCPSGGGGSDDNTNVNDNDNANVNDNTSGAGTAPGGLVGQVVDTRANPIAGVAVRLDNGRSSSTDDNGFYSFSGLSPGSETIAAFSKDGFTTTSRAFAIADSAATPACVVLAPAAQTITIDADSETDERSGDSRVIIPPGALIDEAGDVELTATFLDPSTDDVMAFPGSFERAQAGGNDVALESFGFAIYELTQDGQEVNLAPGTTAQIEYVLPDNAQDRFDIGDTIPLWEFDEDTATWVESGQGEVAIASDSSGRLAWFADIPHFSAWNCDAPLSEKHCLTGRVVVDGSPVAGAQIAAVGISYNGTSTDTTGTDGTFCVEVKRGSTVRVEVRLNESATPVASQIVTVPDTPADCAGGGCTSVGDIDVDFDSCVSGIVTDSDGDPAPGVTLHVVPGQSVITDANGAFCAKAPGNMPVFVFAEGRASVSVSTPSSASCAGGGCAHVDLTLTLPGAGDIVGSLRASKDVTYLGLPSIPGVPDIPGFDDATLSFGLSGSFFIADAGTLENFTFPGFTQETEELGDCTIVTTTMSMTIDDDETPPPIDITGLGALDPGDPGSASNASASVALVRGDPNEADPPAPFLAGTFSTEPAIDPLAFGFDAGQTIVFSFPGGTDIGAFDASIDVPADLNVTSPDLADPDYEPDTSSALTLNWNAGSPSDTVVVTLIASNSEQVFNPDGTFGMTSTSVMIRCEYPDTGQATIAADLMARLPIERDMLMLQIARSNMVEVAVPLNRVGGDGIVVVTGSAGVSRSFFELGLPDPGDDDLCALFDVICEDDEVCNTDAFPPTCEPAGD